MLLIEGTLSSRVAKDFDIQIMKRALLVFGMASITLSASFAQQSSGNSAGGGGTGTPLDQKPFRPFQPTRNKIPNKERKSARDADSERDINSRRQQLSECPLDCRSAPNRIGSSEASQDGLRPAAPGIPSGTRPAATPGTSASVAPTMTTNQATPSPAPTAIPTATPSASPIATPGTTPSASPNPLTR